MTEDVVALSDEELLKRYYGALQAIPRITKDHLEARRRAWDDVFRYHDELLHPIPAEHLAPEGEWAVRSSGLDEWALLH